MEAFWRRREAVPVAGPGEQGLGERQVCASACGARSFGRVRCFRSFRPKPPARAISTIHKAKGLECDSVIVMPCDAKTFPDKADARCLLYVALSRPKRRLALVMSKDNPSPLFKL